MQSYVASEYQEQNRAHSFTLRTYVKQRYGIAVLSSTLGGATAIATQFYSSEMVCLKGKFRRNCEFLDTSVKF